MTSSIRLALLYLKACPEEQRKTVLSKLSFSERLRVENELEKTPDVPLSYLRSHADEVNNLVSVCREGKQGKDEDTRELAPIEKFVLESGLFHVDSQEAAQKYVSSLNDVAAKAIELVLEKVDCDVGRS